MKTFTPFADNVFLQLEDDTVTTASGLVFPSLKAAGAKRTRIGRVIASGPGYWTEPNRTSPQGVFIANTVRQGARVIVEAQAGDNYSKGFHVPRHNGMRACLGHLGELRGEFRIVREAEILGIVEE